MLRCRVREALAHFIEQNHAGCLPRLRATVDLFADGSRVEVKVGQLPGRFGAEVSGS